MTKINFTVPKDVKKNHVIKDLNTGICYIYHGIGEFSIEPTGDDFLAESMQISIKHENERIC